MPDVPLPPPLPPPPPVSEEMSVCEPYAAPRCCGPKSRKPPLSRAETNVESSAGGDCDRRLRSISEPVFACETSGDIKCCCASSRAPAAAAFAEYCEL